MKTLVLICFSLFGLILSAQDTIVKLDGERIVGKVQEVTPDEVKFFKQALSDGPLFVFSKTSIGYIRYSNGELEEIGSIPVNGSNPEMYKLGVKDAKINYRGYKAAGTTTLLVSLYPGMGLYPAIGCSLVRPKPKTFNAPKPALLNNPDYSKGYSDQAFKIKRTKVWTNFVIGTSITLGVILSIVVASMR